MTISESLAFVREFSSAVADLARAVDIVLCPPYTALQPVARALGDSPIGLGAQNLTAARGKAHTGEISAQLLTDVGCEWVLLGHWEIRRRSDETDGDINRKMHAVFQVGLRPILLIGESATERGPAQEELVERLPRVFADVRERQVAQMVVVYEPEWTIGADEPASPNYVAAGCRLIRRWLAEEYGSDLAEKVRTIYGGSVTPARAESLLTSPDVDGLGAGRKGRDPSAFADIVGLIAASKGLA